MKEFLIKWLGGYTKKSQADFYRYEHFYGVPLGLKRVKIKTQWKTSCFKGKFEVMVPIKFTKKQIIEWFENNNSGYTVKILYDWGENTSLEK